MTKFSNEFPNVIYDSFDYGPVDAPGPGGSFFLNMDQFDSVDDFLKARKKRRARMLARHKKAFCEPGGDTTLKNPDGAGTPTPMTGIADKPLTPYPDPDGKPAGTINHNYDLEDRGDGVKENKPYSYTHLNILSLFDEDFIPGERSLDMNGYYGIDDSPFTSEVKEQRVINRNDEPDGPVH
jgi:hypothetical protein